MLCEVVTMNRSACFSFVYTFASLLNMDGCAFSIYCVNVVRFHFDSVSTNRIIQLCGCCLLVLMVLLFVLLLLSVGTSSDRLSITSSSSSSSLPEHQTVLHYIDCTYASQTMSCFGRKLTILHLTACNSCVKFLCYEATFQSGLKICLLKLQIV